MEPCYSVNISPGLTAIERTSVVTEIIRNRRSIYADSYEKKEIRFEQLEEILTNAIWAPTHKMTEPWRFIVLSPEQQREYGSYMTHYYTDKYKNLPLDEQKRKAKYLQKYPLNASAIIAIIFKPSRRVSLPEWEEIAAISCAVQNMALTCTAMELGSYWSSSGSAVEFAKKLGITAQEQSFGLFFIGHLSQDKALEKKRRSPITEKVTGMPSMPIQP